MRILLVTTYFEPDSGAAAVRLSRLAHILHARGHDVTVLTAMPHYPRGEITEAYRGKFAVVEDQNGLRVIRSWLFATKSPRISRKLISQMTFMLSTSLRGFAVKRPDVVLIEAQPVFTSFAGVLLSRLKRVPYVLNVSDLWPDHLLSVGALTETHPIYRAARTLVDATYRGASGITAMSPAWAEKITGYIGRDDKIRVIYNGVDLERFQPGLDTSAFREKYDLGDRRLVAFIGTFATQYDFDATLDIAARFRQRDDVAFVLVGGGSQADVVRERLKQGDLPNVKWVEWVDHNEMPLVWNAAHLTYWIMRDVELYRGTIPAKLYESLACGVPVAAATGGAGAAMIAESGGGITVPPGDVDGLTAAIARLLDDDTEHARIAQSARAYAKARLDPEAVASAYVSMLEMANHEEKRR